MAYNIQTISIFEKQAKRLVKKYPSLKNELLTLIQTLKIVPNHGVSLGNNCFKIRLSIASKGKGKSGGARIITHITVANETVYLLSIFDKSEKENLTDHELRELLDSI